ncbi:MAG: hypothetical protein M0D57_18870 [Sphingobacteriales bacterium JAD_PAG50586_3]|nr:MAG: hypothetical protein M0D57_18870 [Sphingobacteriales bacterium JAD_PAG50586_3]
MSPKKHYLRWLALIAIVTNIAFNYLYPLLNPANPTIAQVSNKYNSLFMPAGYAFSIWGLIYLSFIVYGIVQLVPKSKFNVTYDRLAVPMVIVNALGSLWIVTFTNDQIAASLMVIGGMLVAGAYMFVKAYQCYKSGWARARLLVPFSLFLGWISVAAIANTSIFLKSMQWGAFDLSEETWANAMVITAASLGIIFSILKRNYIFPLVIAWALLAIYVEQKQPYPQIAITAAVAAIAVTFFALAALFRTSQYNKSRSHAASTT